MKYPAMYLLLTGGIWLFTGMAYADDEADVVAGQQLYVQCIACHDPAYHRTGAKHCGLFGRTAGQAKGFSFTSAMENSGIVWDEITLNQFLAAPLDMLPGTSMGFSGIKSATERRQLIKFISTLTDENPLCR